MKIEQYVYFAIASSVLVPDEIGRRVGLVPDHVMIRGSRSEDPPRPKYHKWELRSDERGLGIGEQVERVMGRLAPARDAIRDLVASSDDIAAWLQIVRYFNAEAGEEEEITVTEDGLEKLSGQHQLLGWHLDREVIAFLADVGAEFDADEYG
jgi:hypothetical protein